MASFSPASNPCTATCTLLQWLPWGRGGVLAGPSADSLTDCVRRYESLNPEQIPPLWLIYADSPSDSGRAHSDVRMRWQQGDRAVHEAMAEFASFAEMGRCVLSSRHTDAHQLSRGRLAQWAMCPKVRSGLPEVAYMSLQQTAMTGTDGRYAYRDTILQAP